MGPTFKLVDISQKGILGFGVGPCFFSDLVIASFLLLALFLSLTLHLVGGPSSLPLVLGKGLSLFLALGSDLVRGRVVSVLDSFPCPPPSDAPTAGRTLVQRGELSQNTSRSGQTKCLIACTVSA